MTENKNYTKDLQSLDPKKVIAGIEKMRKTGSPKLLKEILSLLSRTKNKDMKRSILNLLDDLKDESAMSIIIDSINNKNFLGVKSELVSACWKSGLKFTDHLETFTSILVNDELPIAIEAYSVLENNIPELNETQAIKHSEFFKSILQDLPFERKALVSDILEMLIGRI